MEAFHNDPIIKEKYLTRLNKHYQADKIIQGQLYENERGSAVGCTINSGDHSKYESELVIPLIIAYLQDSISDGLPDELAKEFRIEFLSAIKVGFDFKNVKNLFTIWLLTDEKYGVLQYAEDKKVIQDIANAFVQDMVTPVSAEKWEELRKNATVSSYSAFHASIAASYSDASYAAHSAASYAAQTASHFAATAAYIAADYVFSDFSYSADDATYYSNAYSAAHAAYSVSNSKSEYYIAASNKLIELLKNSN